MQTMRAAWVEAGAALVLWLGVAVLLWALGAWLLFAAMGDGAGEMAADVIARGALLVTLVVGFVVSRRSPIGYLVVAFAAAACAVLYGSLVLGDAGMGVMATIELVAATAAAVAAVVVWWMSRTAANRPRPAAASSTRAAGTPARSPAEIAVASSLAIGGLLVLGRSMVLLLEGLAELPGASEHWAGDVALWLVFVLPIPVLAGATMLATARWVWRRRIGSRAAAAIYVGAVGIAVAVMAVEAAWFVGQGSRWGSLDDPLLWAPVALLVGAIAGWVIFAGLDLRVRRRDGGSP